MSFRKIKPTFKFDVVKELWGGSSYSQLSNKHSIPRATIYKWEQTAKDAIIHAFQDKTPGKKNIGLEDENQKLKEQLRILYHDKHRIAQETIKSSVPEPAIIICTECGSSHIKKNGTVLTKKDGLRQRYTCLSCSLSVYIDIKKTLPLSK
ncbi:MAG: hypothetical protein JSW06_01620 [Thermoplasmatales archaeon]|nr:MAG: hypothetical protein JSW06_01620 [Thermoplasmatales archaeon]